MRRKTFRITIKDRFDVREVRERTELGRDSFASLIGVSRRAVESWEQGTRIPSGSARNLLIMTWKHPELVKQTLLDTIEICKS